MAADATPSVSIGTSFNVTNGVAYTCECAPSGSFTATTTNDPTAGVEEIILGPKYAWTISPTGSYLTFATTNEATVNLDLLNSNAWGRSYSVSVVVNWIVSNTETHVVSTPTATTNMQLTVLK